MFYQYINIFLLIPVSSDCPGCTLKRDDYSNTFCYCLEKGWMENIFIVSTTKERSKTLETSRMK